jgi:DmsE family decaheme c-type cytochrome
MTRRVVLATAVLTYLLALTIVAAGEGGASGGGVSGVAGLDAVAAQAGAAPAPPPQAGAAPATPPQAGAPPAYVGSDTCLGCHDDMERGLAPTQHWKAANPRSPAAAHGCESCHGPGERHIDDPTVETSIRKFDQMAPRDVSETCLSCHTRSTHALWEGSAHDARTLSCITCHSVHEPRSPKAQLKVATEIDLCATCHRPQVQKFRRLSHMPLPEGKMQCSSCHNPHGATNVKLLRIGNWVNEMCLSCHAEKRGPFLFEHAAGRESCISCHDPHGSSNDRILVAKLPMLCQRCHIGYDNLAVQNRNSRIIARACVNCHSQIHGSNHPSGQALTR